MEPNQQSGTRQGPEFQAQGCIYHTGGTETPQPSGNPRQEEMCYIAEFNLLSFPVTLVSIFKAVFVSSDTEHSKSNLPDLTPCLSDL